MDYCKLESDNIKNEMKFEITEFPRVGHGGHN